MPPRGHTKAALGPTRAVDPDRLASFRTTFDGRIIDPADPTYEQARHVWNAMIDRRPSLIVRPVGSADVVAAVRYGRDEGLEIAVRGGGHNVAGASTVDDGLVIDLSAMRGVRVDPHAGRAFVQGGALLVDVDRETSPHGLAVPAGVNWDTGIGGLTLGGGYGYLSRLHGLTSDNLVSAEVVAADGRIVRASREEDPELLWGLCGGGGNFGIVTWFEFRTHPVPPTVQSLDVAFPRHRAADLVPAYLELAARLPRTITSYLSISPATAAAGAPEADTDGPMLWIGLIAIDEQVDLAAIVKPLVAVSTPYVSIPFAGPLRVLQRMSSEAPGARRRRYWKGHYIADPSAAFASAFVGHDLETARPFRAEREIFQQGGAIGDRAPDATAFANRDAAFDMLAISYWDDPAEDEAWMSALRACADGLAAFGSGVYLNNLGDEGAARVRDAFRDDRFERLRTLKTRMDPDNVFHRNANIPPRVVGS